MTSRVLALSIALAGGVIASRAQAQDPPKPQVLAEARPMSAADAAARLSGRWKLNEELSRPFDAGSSPLGSGGAQNGRPGSSFGRPQAYEARRLTEERNIRMRALERELETAPATLTLVISVAAAKFVDGVGVERLVHINQKKEKLDLGTAIVDSRARWNGTALTIEIDGGADLKMLEIFELSPTGTQMLVTIRTGDGNDENAQGLRRQVQRVYDRVHAGRP